MLNSPEILEKIKIINISAEMCGLLVCLFGVIVVLIGKTIDRKTGKYFLLFFIFLALDLLSNMMGLITKGHTGRGYFYAVRIANFSEFFFGYLLAVWVTWYILHCIDEEKRMKRLRAGVIVFYLIQILMLAVSQFTKLYYYIDAENVYHRGDGFWISQVFGICSMILNAIIIIKNRDVLSKNEKWAFGIYIILPLIGLVIQIFTYGFYTLLYATILSAVAMFIFIVKERVEKYCEKEQENSEMRIKLMLSQIQPHFLYNSLNAIRELCRINPEKARAAIGDFSEYLRGNMDSLSSNNPIHFSRELSHIETYLKLEKLRFGDDLKVVYDVEEKDFFLPPLTVQPLVENAVKHGICEKKDGGTLILRTYKKDKTIVIKVIDDGIGFNPEGAISKQDNHIHIGIQNIKSRIGRLKNGKLTIESAPGQGTEAKISFEQSQY